MHRLAALRRGFSLERRARLFLRLYRVGRLWKQRSWKTLPRSVGRLRLASADAPDPVEPHAFTRTRVVQRGPQIEIVLAGRLAFHHVGDGTQADAPMRFSAPRLEQRFADAEPVNLPGK